MNVAIDIRNLLVSHISGVGYYTCAMVEELVADTSIQWYIYYNQRKLRKLPPAIERLRDRSNVRIVGTRFPNKVFNLLLMFRVIRLDWVIKKYARIASLEWIIFPNLGFAHVSKKMGVLQVIHDMSFERFPEYYSYRMRMWHYVLSPRSRVCRATYIITPSESTAHDVEQVMGIPRTRIRVLPHGPPRMITHENSTIRFSIPKTFFVALSTIEPRKNFEGIITAYRESGLHRQGVELLVVGRLGWKYGKSVRLLDTTPGITYLGYVTEHEKRELISRAVALVYPSLYEGFGFPILEAFELGTPVITSDCSSMPEVAGGAAYLVRPRVISDTIHAMRDMASHEEVREWYRTKGKRRVSEFSWESVAKGMLELLKNKSA